MCYQIAVRVFAALVLSLVSFVPENVQGEVAVPQVANCTQSVTAFTQATAENGFYKVATVTVVASPVRCLYNFWVWVQDGTNGFGHSHQLICQYDSLVNAFACAGTREPATENYSASVGVWTSRPPHVEAQVFQFGQQTHNWVLSWYNQALPIVMGIGQGAQ